MPRRIVWLAIVTLVAASLASGRTLVADVSSERQYVVKSGETLGEISEVAGVPVDELMALNGLADANSISAGQRLRLPLANSQAAALSTGRQAATGPGSGYVVRAGETLSGIALALGVSIRALIDANQLSDPDRVLAGQNLRVPERVLPSVQTARGTSPAVPGDGSAGLLERTASRHELDPALVKAMAWITSGGRPLSLTGPQALGLLQIAPPTFEYVARTIVKRELDRTNVEDNAEAGAAYLAAMLRWAGEGGESRALAGFIQGPGSVQVSGVRPATEDQVKSILALRSEIKGPARVSTAAPAGGLSDRVSMAARSVAGQAGRIGVAGRDLVSGQRITISAGDAFPAASVAKLWIMAELYRQHHAGIRPLTDAVRADLQQMIVASDNEAANRLVDLAGSKGINGTLAGLGLAGTRLINHFGIGRPASGLLNQTTPSDSLRFMELLAADELVSPSASREMRTMLAQAGDASKLRAGLPAEARLFHKSGWFGGVANDVGLIYHAQNAYALAVFTEGIDDAETANSTIAAIARTVHSAWGPR